jgi:pimeloyl-ACP methyl ester carboxylesterase
MMLMAGGQLTSAVMAQVMVPVEAGELDVLVGGRDGRGTIATLHPAESMHDAVPLLAELTGARVVAVNPRGVGRSSPHRDIRDATIDGMAADLDAVRQALGYRAWVVWGMSAGGTVALASGRWHPEGIEGLIVDSAGPCFASTLADPGCVLSPLHPRWHAILAAVPAQDADGELEWAEVADVGWVLRRGGGLPLVVSQREPSVQLRRVMPALLSFDARPWLGAIEVPTLVLAGAADEVAPLRQLRALHEGVPGASLAVIDGAGHVPVGDRPEEVGLLVQRFLAQRVWV